MVIIDEKQAQLPLHPPPPYVYNPPPATAPAQGGPADTSLAQWQAEQLARQQRALAMQQMQLQQQLAALHLQQRHGTALAAPPQPAITTPSQTHFPPSAPVYTAREVPSLETLPPHLLLKIVYAAFPTGRDLEFVRHRQVLYWLAMYLRTTCRALYVACMHVLRSSYLPAYTGNIRQPYTSDPFPDTAAAAAAQRETEVLDLYLLIKVREDVRLDETELHQDLDPLKDIFDMMQPRARTEDLVRQYGVQMGYITLSAPGEEVAEDPPPHPRALPFAALGVSFSTRRVGLVVTQRGGRKRTLVEVERARDEKLESSARKIVGALGKMLG